MNRCRSSLFRLVPVVIAGAAFLLVGCEADSAAADPSANNDLAASTNANAAGLTNANAALSANATTNATAMVFTNESLLTDTGLTNEEGVEPALPADAPVAPPPELSDTANEVVQLAQAHLGEDVLLSYVEASSTPFNLQAKDIVYLHDLGISAEVISAMVRHDRALREPGAAPENAVEQVANATTNEPSIERAPSSAVAETSTAPPPPPSDEAAPPAEAPPPEPPAEQVTYNYFYNTLSPYGTWLEVPDYGWCWQPTVAVVNPSWQPYCHGGRWIYTDYGWYWQSYYTWGWGPFHYGRWHLSSGCGWVWIPDNHWGPAWVTWRYYDGYCGWAPLPPGCVYRTGFGLTYFGNHVNVSFGFGLGPRCYTFVPTHRFCSGSPWNYSASAAIAAGLYRKSHVINDYQTGPRHHVVNHGIGTGAIAKATHTEIRKVALRDVGSARGTPIRAEHLDRSGRTLAVYRPRLPEQAPRPPAQVTHRQQEIQKQSASIVHSDAVRSASERARLAPIQSRSTGVLGSRTERPNLARPNPGLGERPSVTRSPVTSPRLAPRRTEPLPTRPVPDPNQFAERDEPNRTLPEPEPQRNEPTRRPATRPIQPSENLRSPVVPQRELPQPEPVRPTPRPEFRPQAPSRSFSQPIAPRPSPSFERSAPRSLPEPSRSAPSPPAARSEPRSVPAPSATPAPSRSQPSPSPSRSSGGRGDRR